MSDEKTDQEGTGREIIAIPRIYTNAIHLSHSVYDFQITLGTSVPNLSKEQSEVRVLALQLIYMSPQHAKVFSELLAAQVAQYEKTFGAIPARPKE